MQVLKEGQICDYGKPYELLSNPDSQLLRLVEHTGPVAAQKLKSLAYTAYQSKLGIGIHGTWV